MTIHTNTEPCLVGYLLILAIFIGIVVPALI